MLFKKKYLPVGSVVGLTNDARRLLIVGRQVYSESNHVIRDYAAAEYPNGFVGAKERFVLFNKEDIEVVYHYGYVDEKELELDRLLTEAEQGKIEDRE
ncbi:DUF4176 domain-containing protein [Bacillus haynesii]|uniref:DUF4176 domain-containing protein n=1 Tax=Bacillus haynesii TaxID=1925021 RepID=UPI0012B7B28C|nr:DUF4176 domain-containing protein [Bacillus haynesii]MCY7837193.1 DUF4176 domain-containing protein [Bacillus haynesii]MCY7844165.1 DUF4176 domain-containing protein [Bacillus haynesii]MCY7966865.1 DUF4176 domain-containing protein [Bacillus haynesii]MCY8016196.1 DUF4176 domain-containing protein [Bacillus haynesii]MCY8092507.1 DUF4176 domain-containing protein [Bacillus haynesii]